MAQPKCFTEMWAVKMRKVFHSLDWVKKGYITEAMLIEVVDKFYKDYPDVEKERIKDNTRYTWKHLYNNGRDAPNDHRLTEEMFVENLWVSVNQPNFKEDIYAVFKESFQHMNLTNKGYITKEEYMKWYTWRSGEEQAAAAFALMDTDKDGKASYDELMEAKAFYYIDTTDEKHPFNLMNGPLDTPYIITQPKSNFTEMWAVKMRKVFHCLDRERNGYITEAMLIEMGDKFYKDYPEVEKERIKEQNHHTWKHLYNHGKDVPKDHQLTEEMFVKNMWVSVNQPNFKEEINAVFREGFLQMDHTHKGYLTKEEYMKWYTWRSGEEQAAAAFALMDTDKDGKVSYDDLIEAKAFYYIDTTDEKHPFNLMNGPLNNPFVPERKKC